MISVWLLAPAIETRPSKAETWPNAIARKMCVLSWEPVCDETASKKEPDMDPVSMPGSENGLNLARTLALTKPLATFLHFADLHCAPPFRKGFIAFVATLQ